MICEPCASAGKQNQYAMTRAENEMQRSLCLDAAKGLHRRCRRGTWCDCHHDLGKALIDQKIRELEQDVMAVVE